MLTLDRYNTMLPKEKLAQLAQSEAENYSTALPFKHGVYDDVFDPEILDTILSEFESVQDQWKSFDTKYEKKLQYNRDENLPPVTRAFIHNLNSEPFIEFLRDLTGIQGLMADPYLVGGGLHNIPRGGKLGIHIDFNQHKIMNVYRRLNVIIYLNKDWREEYGGHFELWREQNGGCEKKVLPIFNRMAIFDTTGKSFHGHPEPLACPEDRSRRSLALYYYAAKDSGQQSNSKHGTVFLDEDGRRDALKKKGVLAKLKTKLSS